MIQVADELKQRHLYDVKALTIAELPPDYPELEPKESLYHLITSPSDKYYECKATGERLSVEKFKELPDFITPLR